MLMKCFLVVFVEFSKHYFAVKKLYSVSLRFSFAKCS